MIILAAIDYRAMRTEEQLLRAREETDIIIYAR